MKFVGFDYSMSTPAMCILPDEEASWSKSTTYFLTDTKKFAGVFGTQRGFQLIGENHNPYTSQEQRFDNIARYFLYWIPKPAETFIAIEDYSMGSKGKVFHIAENTGHMKYLLWHYNYRGFLLIPPTVIKKFATGKGNAKKEQMFQAFSEAQGIDLSKIMGQEGKLASPVTDIVDAYFIAKYAQGVYREQNRKRAQGSQT